MVSIQPFVQYAWRFGGSVVVCATALVWGSLDLITNLFFGVLSLISPRLEPQVRALWTQCHVLWLRCAHAFCSHQLSEQIQSLQTENKQLQAQMDIMRALQGDGGEKLSMLQLKIQCLQSENDFLRKMSSQPPSTPVPLFPTTDPYQTLYDYSLPVLEQSVWTAGEAWLRSSTDASRLEALRLALSSVLSVRTLMHVVQEPSLCLLKEGV